MTNLHLAITIMDGRDRLANHIDERLTILGAGRLAQIWLSGHGDRLIHTKAGCLSLPSERLVLAEHASEPECIIEGWRLRY